MTRRLFHQALLLTSLVVLLGALAQPAFGQRYSGKRRGIEFRTVTIKTLPPTPGVKLRKKGGRGAGQTVITNSRGEAKIRVTTYASGHVRRVGQQIIALPSKVNDRLEARFGRWYPGRKTVALDLHYRTSLHFTDLDGKPVDSDKVTAVTLKSRHGIRRTYPSGENLLLQGSRIVPLTGRLETKEIDYSVERVEVDGMNVVNRAQQRFLPSRVKQVNVALLFYPTKFSSSDSLFGFPLGSTLVLEYPNGKVERHKFESGSSITLPSLPRGEYQVTVEAPGFSFTRPVSVSRKQDVELEVLSYMDIVFVLGLLAALALWLPLARRPAWATYLWDRVRLRKAARPEAEKAPAVKAPSGSKDALVELLYDQGRGHDELADFLNASPEHVRALERRAVSELMSDRPATVTAPAEAPRENGRGRGRFRRASENGHSSNGHSSNGHPSNGHPSNGHSSNGHSSNGHSSNGHSGNGHAPNGNGTYEEHPGGD